jgi:membrane protein implicated in regulation of membrane protease activity
MGIKIWWIWMAVAAFFVVAEMFTLGFFLLWFGVAAAVAGILALAGLGPAWQLGSFVVISAILIAVSRGFAEKFTKKQPAGVGADRFVHQRGVVIEEIDNLNNRGRVRIGKEEWRADSHNDEVIAEGKMVQVTSVDGTHLVVKTVKEGE